MNDTNLIVIDTASFDLKIAVSIMGRELFVDKKDSSNQNVEMLIPIIDSVFKELEVSPDIINNIAVCVGPGSFTGIRVGLAASFGLILGKEIDIVGFSQFDVYRFLLKNRPNSAIIPVIDAKKNSLYTSFISTSKSSSDNENSYPAGECLTIDDFFCKIKEIDNNICFTGKDFSLIKERVDRELNRDYEYCYPDNYSSKDMFYAIKEMIESGEKGSTEPLYLRKSDAELLLLTLSR